MKRIIGLCLVLAMLLTICAVGAVSANAEIMLVFYRYGDVDFDDEVTAVDATLIQRHILHIHELSQLAEVAADYDHDGELTVVDATLVQREVLHISIPAGYGGEFSDENRIVNFYGDYCSGKAMVGVPVTFTAEAVTGTPVIHYEFWIRKPITATQYEVMYSSSASTENQFTYTFEEPGYYQIGVHSIDQVNERDLSSAYADIRFYVVEPYSLDEPVICNYHYNSIDNGTEVTVGAIGGTAPYQYCYTVTDFTTKSAYDDGVWKSVGEGEMVYSTGYIDQDTVPILPRSITSYYQYNIIVTVKDANGLESESYYVPSPELIDG